MDKRLTFGQIAETGPKVVQIFVFFHKKRAATNLTTLPNGDTPFPIMEHVHCSGAKIRARLCRLLPQGRKNFNRNFQIILGKNAKYPDFIRERVYALYDATFWCHEYGKEAILKESD
jgi:hypothetical protein